jgi:DNA-binding NarL/FixJ family response regulator
VWTQAAETEPTGLDLNKPDRVLRLSRPRVLLADDHALLLGEFEKLSADCDIVGQLSGRALVHAADELKLDVIILDHSLLSLTPRTVAFHKYRTMEQLKVKSTAELVQYAVKNHIV